MKLSFPVIKNMPAQMCFQMAKCWIKSMEIKERLSKDELTTFTPSNGWFQKFIIILKNNIERFFWSLE